MRVFVTGSTGFIGSAVVKELLNAGHQVVGLTRSAEKGKALTAAGAEVLHGTLDDHDILKKGAAESDGVIHLAFEHDFSNFENSCKKDQGAIEAMASVLEGSNRPLITTSGTLLLPPGKVGTEDDEGIPNPRGLSERLTLSFAAKGVRASVVRLAPTVHDTDDKGFVPRLITIARQTGESAYIDTGASSTPGHWPAVHRLDAALGFRLALEHGPAGSRFHLVAEQGIPTKTIAETIATGLGSIKLTSKSPGDEAVQHFGFLGMLFAVDNVVSSAKTQEVLGWKPVHVGLLEDMEKGGWYFSDENMGDRWTG